MTDLADFDAGVDPDDDPDSESRESDTYAARREQYRHAAGRCRAIAKSDGSRCAGAIGDSSDGPWCFYHDLDDRRVSVDDPPDELATWCGTEQYALDKAPRPCRAAIQEVTAGE
jgi:hypothetical protein